MRLYQQHNDYVARALNRIREMEAKCIPQPRIKNGRFVDKIVLSARELGLVKRAAL
jgi:hypothetical protein